MKIVLISLGLAMFLGLIGTAVQASASDDLPAPWQAAQLVPARKTSTHDFDFEFGNWRVHHKIKTASAPDIWTEFDGTSNTRPLMHGSANVEDNDFHKPGALRMGSHFVPTTRRLRLGESGGWTAEIRMERSIHR